MPKILPPRAGLALQRTDGDAICQTVEARLIDVSPGDMTRYRFVVTPYHFGGLLVIDSVNHNVWLTDDVQGHRVRLLSGGRGKPGDDYDAQMIGALLDEHVRTP